MNFIGSLAVQNTAMTGGPVICIVVVILCISMKTLALPLKTLSNQIVDENNERVRLHCVNWYGAHMENHISNGLNAQTIDTISASIRSMGFNCVRLPFSTELYYANPTITNETVVSANQNLLGLTALEVLDLTVESLTKNGLMVILNNHIGKACWCCSETDGEGLWYTDTYPESKFIESWTELTTRYKSNPYVVGADLRNEIRPANGVIPTWGDGVAETDWHAAATRCGNAVLAVNPDLLIIVESLSYSTDFTGVAQHPIQLDVANRLVYSPHDYGWSQKAESYEVFHAMMERQWGYILTPNKPYTAPLWLSEFGTDNSSEWWGWIRQYITEKDISWSYWALDGQKYVGVDETFGLFMQDYTTIRHDWKLADLQKLMEN